jgi:predicted alpha/beta-hydrolase family hydrolase
VKEVRGCICLGYPFHPPGKPTKLRTAHLEDINTPICIIQGTRDPFGTKEEVQSYKLSSNINITWLENGEHSFKTRKKDPHTQAELLQKAIDTSIEFIKTSLQ